MSLRMEARLSCGALLLSLLAACTAGPSTQDDATRDQMTTTSAAADSGGWHSLLDDSLSHWRGYHEQTVPAGWRVDDGVLTKSGSVGDLITRDQFGDFELTLDWKLSPGGNAGLFYRATEQYDRVYWSGPEYQLLDDAGHPDGKSRLTSAGAAYAIYSSPAGIVKPADEWNSTRILVRGNHVEHWLNGQKLLEYELGSPDWKARVAASKFVDYPQYGLAPRGHIGIQGDHDGTLSLRDIRIRELR